MADILIDIAIRILVANVVLFWWLYHGRYIKADLMKSISARSPSSES